MRSPVRTLLISGVLIASVAHSMEADHLAKTHGGAAQQGLAILKELVRDGNDTGFGSFADVARATLGIPLKVSHVDTKRLAKFKSGDDPNQLLIEEPALFYPVMLDGKVMSSIRVQKLNGGWEPALVGNASLATGVAKALAGFGANPTDTSTDTSLVAVLPLNVLFVAKTINSTLEFVAVGGEPRAGIKAGGRLSASAAFARLAPLADALMQGEDKPS